MSNLYTVYKSESVGIVMMVSNISVAFIAILAAAVVIPAAKKKYLETNAEKSKRFHILGFKNIKNLKKI